MKRGKQKEGSNFKGWPIMRARARQTGTGASQARRGSLATLLLEPFTALSLPACLPDETSRIAFSPGLTSTRRTPTYRRTLLSTVATSILLRISLFPSSPTTALPLRPSSTIWAHRDRDPS